MLARTLRANKRAQVLHADLLRDSADAPLLGFILMIDPFREDKGAARLVPGSQHWPDLPDDRVLDLYAPHAEEVLGGGKPGSMIVFNAEVWHGHTVNTTTCVRRSAQGYSVRRNVKAGFDFAHRYSIPGADQSPSLGSIAASFQGLSPHKWLIIQPSVP